MPPSISGDEGGQITLDQSFKKLSNFRREFSESCSKAKGPRPRPRLSTRCFFLHYSCVACLDSLSSGLFPHEFVFGLVSSEHYHDLCVPFLASDRHALAVAVYPTTHELLSIRQVMPQSFQYN
jgi:hypothetical protein